MTIQVLQKSDSSLIATRVIKLHNPVVDNSIDPTRVTMTLNWQNYTYLLGKEDKSLSDYVCDPSHTECKINLQLLPFLDGIASNRLTCAITTDFLLVPTTDPCNPNSSSVPAGDHILSMQILDKTNNNMLLIRREITLHGLVAPPVIIPPS